MATQIFWQLKYLVLYSAWADQRLPPLLQITHLQMVVTQLCSN